MPSNEQSPLHYAHEAQMTRERLARNLDEFSERLTPGQVFDEMLTYAKGGSGSFVRAFSNATRENPILSLLIGAGCMIFLSEKMGVNRLMARRNHSEPRRAEPMSRRDSAIGSATDAAAASAGKIKDSGESGARGVADFASAQARNMGEAMRQSAAATSDHVRTGAQNLRERAADAAGQVAEGAQAVAEQVNDYSTGVGHQVSGAAASARRQAMQATAALKAAVASLIEEQPLLCAAMGVAIGAAIAAILPSTETEDELLGETSDHVKTALRETSSDGLERAKDVAGAVLKDAKAAAEREGLTPAATAEAVRTAETSSTSGDDAALADGKPEA
jgi:Protein of unknown function (DUF3618)